MRSRARRILPLLLLLAFSLASAVLAMRGAQLRTDTAALLPQGRTEVTRVLTEVLRFGAPSRLILIGIEGASPQALAAMSRSISASLTSSGHFALVANGSGDPTDTAGARFLFAHRYLLSPSVTPDAFTEPALHADLLRLLRGLQTFAAPLLTRFGFADPTGAALSVAEAWGGARKIRTVDGVWFAPQQDRSVILALLAAPGLDTAAGARADSAIRAAFSAAKPTHGTRLLVTGAPVFATRAAHVIRRDAERVSFLAAVGISLLLLWRFRSPLVFAAIIAPVALGFAAGAAAIRLAFGSIDAAALGFGVTMLGITVDYPVLLIGHRKRGEPPAQTIHRIGRAFGLAVGTALLGLSGMLLAGLPGLRELGLFATTGLAVAALTTRFVLPPMIATAALAPVAAGSPHRLLRIERLRRWRGAGLAIVAVAGIYLLATGGPRWEHRLAALSPVPARALAEDASLRADLGVPAAGPIALVQADSAEHVLEREEQLLTVLGKLQQQGIIDRAETAANLLPSEATQTRRRAALPDAAVLKTSLDKATEGLPFEPDAFAAFQTDVAAARHGGPLGPADVTDPVLAARLSGLLLRLPDGWAGVVAPIGLRDPRSFDTAMRAAGALPIDPAAETSAIVARATQTALRWLGIGAAAAIALLFVGLRDWRMLGRVVGAVTGALIVTVAILDAAGARFSAFHIVALQLVAGIGLDYALFFARRQLDEEERARTLRTLLLCNGAALLSFGLLAASHTPLLRDIGSTVSLGVAMALVLGFLFAGPGAREST